MKLAFTTTILGLLLSLTSFHVEARMGASARRKEVQHRKLYWADETVAIPGRYVIVFQDNFGEEDAFSESMFFFADALGEEAQIVDVFSSSVFNGMTVDNVESGKLLDAAESPDVKFIVEDHLVFETAAPRSWGLDRIDQADLPLDSKFALSTDGPSGNGVEAYILDSGVYMDHTEFSGRIRCGKNTVDSTGCVDVRGHGTHVAGTVAGKTFGIARDAKVVVVKILSDAGRGTLSTVLGGVNYVISEKEKRPNQPMVVNMSISGGGPSPGLDEAINKANDLGIIFVVSAGNNNKDACKVSPAMAAGAIAVGSTSTTDSRSLFSNYGACINMFAPGSSIVSASNKNPTATAAKSGTSMASPHVAGVAALYLEQHPEWKSAQILFALDLHASKGRIKDAGPGSPNVLLNVAASFLDQSDNDAGNNGDPVDVTPGGSGSGGGSSGSGGGQCAGAFQSCDSSSCCFPWRCSIFGGWCFIF